jgi:hypothetical protein
VTTAARARAARPSTPAWSTAASSSTPPDPSSTISVGAQTWPAPSSCGERHRAPPGGPHQVGHRWGVAGRDHGEQP